ncbi:MAG: succinate--CoA ligase subunit alpha [Rhodospirillales bacterium]|nr:succinate--CoA ligase subunit alpha [Rhodospirillales bacterium]MBO6787053.1 succinate--CoA ligase subunit alpha [Rhodospirillales bacterium]
MSILCNSETKLIVQGMTGRSGTFYTDQAMTYGTNVVGGVRPGKGGKKHIGRPIFNTVRDAMTETGANATMVMVPAHNAAAAMIEAIEAGMPLIVCVTERIPVLDMIRVKDALKNSQSELVGPNSQGVLTPGACKIGVMSTADAMPGTIGIASRSASLTSEVVANLTALGLGQSTTVGIGGDPVHGIGFVRCLELFMNDPDTKGVVLIGEIGGNEEEQAAAFIKENRLAKPVTALVVGRHAPPQRRMGHAGTLSVFGSGNAASKNAVLKSAGVHVVENVDDVAQAMVGSLAAA